ncbi:MAG: PDZ domain-containing protein [Phycisphaerales bacterium]|nr:PDZ domain-containing protein [Phycisphaerales bacterium]|tara:strand:+ start:2055 stop:3056 length:1002 start_codon:yes stop_codon:yes gene_type:complete
MIQFLLPILMMIQSPVAPAPAPDVPSIRMVGEQDYVELVGLLDSSDWNERESATWRLARATADVPDIRIERSLGQEGLSLEQVMRLLRVMEIRLLHAPRGALGIQMPMNRVARPGDILRIEPRGVGVSAVIPGLPAEKILQVGDVITHINGIPLEDREDLARIVQQHWPDDVLALRINRMLPGQQGIEPQDREVERLELEITLGSTAVLRRSGGTQSVLDPALADRRQRLMELYQKHGAVPSSIPSPRAPEIGSIEEEQDPLIRGILQQVEGIRNGTYPATLADLHPQWEAKIKSIDDQLSSTDLQPEQRLKLEVRRDRLQAILDATESANRF